MSEPRPATARSRPLGVDGLAESPTRQFALSLFIGFIYLALTRIGGEEAIWHTVVEAAVIAFIALMSMRVHFFARTIRELTDLLAAFSEQAREMEVHYRDIRVQLRYGSKVPVQVAEALESLPMREKEECLKVLAESYAEHTVALTRHAQRNAILRTKETSIAWATHVASILGIQARKMEEGQLLLSSESYADCVVSIADNLLRSESEGTFWVLLVTAMLPQEFFNWPQTAIECGTGKPVYIARTWHGAGQYFESLQQLAREQKLVLRRSILVGALATDAKALIHQPWVRPYDQLRKASAWSMMNEPMSIAAMAQCKMAKLLPSTVGIRGCKFEDLETISGIDKFLFYPMGPKELFEAVKLKPEEKLISRFVSHFHSSEDDALFLPVTEMEPEVLHTLEGTAPGQMPEWAFFGKISQAQCDLPREHQQCGVEWLLAINGALRPFSQSVRVRFLAGPDLQPLKEVASLINIQSHHLRILQ